MGERETNLVSKLNKERVVKLSADKRTVGLQYDAILFAILNDRPVLAVRVDLIQGALASREQVRPIYILTSI